MYIRRKKSNLCMRRRKPFLFFCPFLLQNQRHSSLITTEIKFSLLLHVYKHYISIENDIQITADKTIYSPRQFYISWSATSSQWSIRCTSCWFWQLPLLQTVQRTAFELVRSHWKAIYELVIKLSNDADIFQG